MASISMPVSTVASVAARHVEGGDFAACVIYDYGYECFDSLNDVHFYDSQEFVATDDISYNALLHRGYVNVKRYFHDREIRFPCRICKDKQCIVSRAFVGWRQRVRKMGITLHHGNVGKTKFNSPNSQVFCVSLKFDGENRVSRGTLVADDGYVDSDEDPEKWLLPILQSNDDVVLVSEGRRTAEFLRTRTGRQIIAKDDKLDFPCKQCGEDDCTLVKAYYAWRKFVLLASQPDCTNKI